MKTSNFTPFYFPEFGWFVLLVLAFGLRAELKGETERYLQSSVRPEAPFLLLRIIRFIAYGAVSLMAVGLLVQSELVTYLGMIAFVAAAALLGGISHRYAKRDQIS